MSTLEWTAEIKAELAEILPKSQHKKIDEICALFLPDAVRSLEVIGAHIEVETIEYPGGSVSLDAAGNMVRADFDADCLVVDE